MSAIERTGRQPALGALASCRPKLVFQNRQERGHQQNAPPATRRRHHLLIGQDGSLSIWTTEASAARHRIANDAPAPTETSFALSGEIQKRRGGRPFPSQSKKQNIDPRSYLVPPSFLPASARSKRSEALLSHQTSAECQRSSTGGLAGHSIDSSQPAASTDQRSTPETLNPPIALDAGAHLAALAGCVGACG